MNAIAAKMANVGKVMTVAGAAITTGFGLTVKAAIGFNKEIANIATLIPGSTKRVDELKSAIRDMAVTVGKDTTDLAQGAYQVISAFGDTADTVGILGISAKAATAGVATTTDAINLLSAVTKGYGDTSSEAVQKASDLAFQTVTLGQTTFPELAASIGKVIPLTSELGVSQEELFAVMATGTGVTGQASEVATQLRGIMQALMSPTTAMTTLLEEKGYATGKAMLADLGLAGSLDLIKSAAEASGEPLQKYISSIEGQTLALALTGTQADNYITKLAAMKDSVGLTDIAFKEQTEGVNAAGFAFEQAKIQIGVMAQEVGDKLLPILVPLIQKFTEVIGKISEWTKNNPELTAAIVKWGAAIGGIMLVLGPLLIALPQLVAAFKIVKTATTAMGVIGSGPLGLLILAIGAVYLAWKNWDKIVAFIKGWSNKIIRYLKYFKGLAIAEVTKMIDWIIKKFEDLANLPRKMLEWGKDAITGFTDGIKRKMGAVTDAVRGVGDKIKGFLGFESPPKEGPLSTSDKWMPNMMAMFGEGITDNLDLVYQPVETLSTGVSKIFTTLKGDLKDIIGKIVGYLENNLANAISNLLSGKENVELTWKSFWKGLKDILITAVSAMIAKLIILASFSWLFKLLGLPLSWLGLEKGGEVGYEKGGKVKGYAPGGGTDTVPAMLTPGEYVISKPMVDFIKRTGAVTSDLVSAISSGARTPTASFAGGGGVGVSDNRKNYTSSIQIMPGAIVINTPKFGEGDAQNMFRLIERQARNRGLKFAID